MSSPRTLSSHARVGAILALLSGSLFAACDNSELEAAVKQLGEGCLLDSDCDGELVCVYRLCHVECVDTPDCKEKGQETICVLGDRPTNVCLLDNESTCEVTEAADGALTFDSSSCAQGMVCARDGLCRDACGNDGDCVTGQQCLKGTCADSLAEGLPAESPLLNDEKGDTSASCSYNSECKSPLVCRFGICAAECLEDRDCPDDERCVLPPSGEVTNAKECVAASQPGGGPPHCADGLKSGDEADVDCGGSCQPCPAGEDCIEDGDCASDHCLNDVCQVPTCGDGKRNGTELGVDCGGACPNGCPTGTTCTEPGDCTTPDVCDLGSGVCIAPTCLDGVLNGSETSADCGGAECAPCDDGKGCVTLGDCTSLVCAAGICIAAGCNDGVHNGAEADVDCGGATSGCAPCGNGADCGAASDCVTQNCATGTCAPPSCGDGVQNGFELGIDCGGSCPTGCPLGTACNDDGDCDLTAGAVGCGPTGQCTAKTTLTVTVDGLGAGSVTSSVAGIINCGNLCAAELYPGTSVTLDANVAQSSAFAGFGGACAGNTCTVLVGATDVSVTASFAPALGPGLANWAVNPGIGGSTFRAMAVDSQGYLFVGGELQGTGNFGCQDLSGFSGDAYIVKLAPGPIDLADMCVASLADGSAAESESVRQLLVDAADDVIAVISAEDPSFDPAGQLTTCSHTTGDRLVLAKYDGALTSTVEWAYCYGQNITVIEAAQDAAGNIFVAGTFVGTNTDFGDPTTPLPLLSSSVRVPFIAKYDTNGRPLAARAIGPNVNGNTLYDIDIDPSSGDVALAIDCLNPIDFGNGVVATGPTNNRDACVVELDNDLGAKWLYELIEPGTDTTRAVAYLPSGHLFAGLAVTGQVNFGDTVWSNGFGQSDIALLELDGAPVGTQGHLLSTAANASWRRYGSSAAEVPLAIEVDQATGRVFAAASSYGFQGSVSWALDGHDVDGAVLVWRSDTALGVPVWLEASGVTVQSDAVDTLMLDQMGAPLLLGRTVAASGYDWGWPIVNFNWLIRLNK